VEDGPQNFRVQHVTLVVFEVQTLDDLVNLAVLYSDALVAKRRRQLPQEVGQLQSVHLDVARWLKLGPGVLECLYVSLCN